MTEYFYLTSDHPLEDLSSKGINEPFYSELYFNENLDEDTHERFNFSRHFKQQRFQGGCISSLPEKGKMTDQGKALFDYIQRQFNVQQVSKIEMLFSLNGYEDTALSERHRIHINDLKIEDLYYKESKFLEIVLFDETYYTSYLYHQKQQN